jgi:predicted dienelactone hydrolase
MSTMQMLRIPALLFGCLVTMPALATDPPSRPAIDAPELARLGDAAVGVRTITLIDRNQPDVLAIDPTTNQPALHDRVLTVDIWYPARTLPGATPATYTDVMPSEPPAPPLEFTTQGIAVRNAPPLPGRHPLVIVSHGYGNATVTMSWLTENLASKGYVVAAIRHQDPIPRDDAHRVVLLLRRPLDIAFVTRSLQESLAADGSVDPERTALIGYSMGGYGVLTSAGGELDPDGLTAKAVPAGLLLPYVRGGALRQRLLVGGLRAVVAISPAGGGRRGAWIAPGRLQAWGPDGLAGIHVPMMLIAGDKDVTVGYDDAARAFFDAATHSRRYLLTYKGGGHHLGLIPAPESMRGSLWHINYFEDMVWRTERVLGINLHMITAFLDRYVRDDESRASYLDGLVPDANDGVWPDKLVTRYGTYSPGTGEITVWKGFQRGYAVNLELLQRAPQSP